MVLSINFITKNWNGVNSTIRQIKLDIDQLKITMEEDFRKINFDSVKSILTLIT